MSKQKIKNLEIDRKTTEALSRSIEALKRGEVIVFPTETFYGLAAVLVVLFYLEELR